VKKLVVISTNFFVLYKLLIESVDYSNNTIKMNFEVFNVGIQN
jgi:hypothetical protein